MAGANRLKEQRSAFHKAIRDEAGNGQQNKLVSFNPTEEQKLTIKNDQRPIEDVMASLEATLQDGHVFTIKYQQKYDAFSFIIREAGTDWQKSLSLSVWHNSLDRCFRIMSYALTMVYPEFPLGVERQAFSDTDW